MKAFLKHLKLTFTLFSSPNIDDSVQEAFESLNQMFETLKETTFDDESEDEGVKPRDDDETDNKITLDKPFKAYINQQMNGYRSCNDRKTKY